MNKKSFRIVLVVIGIIVLALIVVPIIFAGRNDVNGTAKVKVGYITPGNKEEAGWNSVHMESIQRVCSEQKVELVFEENVKEFTGECPKAIERLVQAGANVIFLNSYNYTKEAIDVINKYPDINFYANESGAYGKNLSSYFVRMYQARYLAGVIAGMKTESDKIGYVAAMSNNEVNRGINAFTLGVNSVNPDAVVLVHWTGDWDNEDNERAATRKLVESGADVVTYHQNQAYVAYEADALGVYSIAYHQMPKNVSDKCMAAIVCDWDVVYREIIKEYMQGKGNVKNNYWIGIDKKAVMLTEYSVQVDDEVKQKVAQAEQAIVMGKDVFYGKIYDASGTIRCGENELISDQVLLEKMDWFVKGVQLYE